MGTLINDCDQCWFDHVAQEVNQLAGTTARIFQFEESESEFDDIYDEEVTTVYKKDDQGNVGILCPVFFKAPDKSSLMGEEGFRTDRVTTLEVAAKDLRDRDLRPLRAGDIILVWDMYLDVTEEYREDGVINDSPVTSVRKFDVVRRTKAVPESIWRPGEDG